MDTSAEATANLDDVTTYYLLHRHDFGMDDAPAGACILYAVSCNLSEGELADKYDVLVRSGGVDRDDDGEPDEGDADAEGEAEEGTGSTFKLKPWKQRKRLGMGMDPVADSARWRRLQEEAKGPWLSPDLAPPEPTPPVARMIPLIDQVPSPDAPVEGRRSDQSGRYLEERGLRRNAVFQPLLQALIELSPEGSEERRVLESIMNHVRARVYWPRVRPCCRSHRSRNRRMRHDHADRGPELPVSAIHPTTALSLPRSRRPKRQRQDLVPGPGGFPGQLVSDGLEAAVARAESELLRPGLGSEEQPVRTGGGGEHPEEHQPPWDSPDYDSFGMRWPSGLTRNPGNYASSMNKILLGLWGSKEQKAKRGSSQYRRRFSLGRRIVTGVHSFIGRVRTSSTSCRNSASTNVGEPTRDDYWIAGRPTHDKAIFDQLPEDHFPRRRGLPMC